MQLLHFGQKTTEQITVQLDFGGNGYQCVWQPTVDDRLFFAKETCIFYGDMLKTFFEPLGTGHLESRLPEAAKARDVPKYVFKGLVSWQVYHFHDADSLSDWLQEYALGELWEKNVLGGRPTR